MFCGITPRVFRIYPSINRLSFNHMSSLHSLLFFSRSNLLPFTATCALLIYVGVNILFDGNHVFILLFFYFFFSSPPAILFYFGSSPFLFLFILLSILITVIFLYLVPHSQSPMSHLIIVKSHECSVIQPALCSIHS